MQQITTQHPWNYNHFWNEPGTYLLENNAAAACISQSPDCDVETRDWRKTTGFSSIACKDGDKILIVRPGAYGDLLMLTPTIRALRDQFPLCEVTVACAEAYMAALRGTVGVVRYPLTLEEFNNYDHCIWMEDVLENNKLAKETEGVQMFAERAGIHLSTGKHLDYEVSEIEMGQVQQKLPREAGKIRIAIQCRASSPTRTYSTENWIKVIRGLWKKNCEIFLLGAPGQVAGFSGETGVVDVHNMTEVPLSFRQSAAVVKSSDLLITVDSAMMHVAGAVGTKCLSLHGAFPSEIRTANLQENYPLTGDCSKCEIAPCHYHQKGSQVFPAGQICEQEGHCVVLDDISPSVIITKASKLLNIEHHARKDANGKKIK